MRIDWRWSRGSARSREWRGTLLKAVVTSALMVALAVIGSLVITACEPDIKTGDSTKTEMEQTEQNQQRLVAAVPPPQLTDSLERHNLKSRLERLNKADSIGYVYLLSQDGKIVAYYTVKGKVSSLNSYLTTPVQVVRVPNNDHHELHDLPSPDFDGSYGKNPEGIFFFTTSGAYVEWTGHYLYSDQPLKLSQPPVMVMEISDKPEPNLPPMTVPVVDAGLAKKVQ